MMMTSNTNTQAQEKEDAVTQANAILKSSTAERLHTVAKQLGKPVFSTMQPLSNLGTWEQATQTVVVLGLHNTVANHKAKFQDNQLINELQAQVEQVAYGLQQLACTQQFEEETLKLFQKMQKAFQTNNTALYQRHWNSWLQVIDLLEQQTATLYGNTAITAQETKATTFFAPYCLPGWLVEKALPEAKEALATYEQFWLAQQQETANRLLNANHFSNQVQIKLENWLAAKTAPKSN